MKNREKLFNIIERKIINGTSDLQDYIRSQVVADGRLPNHIFDKVLKKSIPLDFFQDSVIFWFAEALEKFDNKLCKTSDYFEEIEILNAKMYVYPEENINDYLVFKNAVKLSSNPEQYLCTASVKQLGILRQNDITKVSTDAQRDSHVIRFKGEELRIIKINKKRVKEISDKITEGAYYFNDIRLNVVKESNGLPSINYDEKKRIITIDKDSLVIIPDGNHRDIACADSLTMHPDKIHYYETILFPVLITNETIAGCRKIVDQEWNREPVSTHQVKSMKRTEANQIIEMIIASDTADPLYSKKIVRSKKEIDLKNGFMLVHVLSDAIEMFYDRNNLKSMVERQNLKDWIEKVFNEIAYIFQYDFKNYATVKNFKWNVLPSAGYLYIALTSMLKGDENWKEHLKKILDSVEWDIDKNPYKGIYKLNKIKSKTDEMIFVRKDIM